MNNVNKKGPNTHSYNWFLTIAVSTILEMIDTKMVWGVSSQPSQSFENGYYFTYFQYDMKDYHFNYPGDKVK